MRVVMEKIIQRFLHSDDKSIYTTSENIFKILNDQKLSSQGSRMGQQ